MTWHVRRLAYSFFCGSKLVRVTDRPYVGQRQKRVWRQPNWQSPAHRTCLPRLLHDCIMRMVSLFEEWHTGSLPAWYLYAQAREPHFLATKQKPTTAPLRSENTVFIQLSCMNLHLCSSIPPATSFHKGLCKGTTRSNTPFTSPRPCELVCALSSSRLAVAPTSGN